MTGGVLVRGLFHERLVDLTPLARSAVLDSMADAVFVLDPFGRIVDVNPAAVVLTSSSRAALLGRRLEDVLPDTEGAAAELTLPGPDRSTDSPEGTQCGGERTFDISHQELTDSSDRPAGELVVLREITERVRDQDRLERVLVESPGSPPRCRPA